MRSSMAKTDTPEIMLGRYHAREVTLAQLQRRRLEAAENLSSAKKAMKKLKAEAPAEGTESCREPRGRPRLRRRGLGAEQAPLHMDAAAREEAWAEAEALQQRKQEADAPAAANDDKPHALDDIPVPKLLDAIRASKGSLTEAGKVLGITRDAMRRRCEHHGIDYKAMKL